MGGRRHGLGFLASIRELDGIPLARPTLVQARYEWSPEKKQLLLAPGCVLAKPQTLDAALGVVLSPDVRIALPQLPWQPESTGSGRDGGVVVKAATVPGLVIFWR